MMSAWTLFVDFGLAALLLLVGQYLRATVPLLQRLFLPASIIGGLLGLVLGPNGLGLLGFSEAFSKYPGILITFVFASLPFSVPQTGLKSLSRGAAEMWSYSVLTILWQWGLPLLFCLALLRVIWPDLHDGFGSILVCGFVGGHGTAAAVGTAFASFGWEEAESLAMTSATVGIISAIVGGVWWTRWGAANGHARFVTKFNDLPRALRTGLVRPDQQASLGKETVSSNTIDVLIFHFAVIALAALGGYQLSVFLGPHIGRIFESPSAGYSLPPFCLAYVVAIILHRSLKHFGATAYLDRAVMSRIGGSVTDVLVVFGIASIKLSVLVTYAVPLSLLFVFGLLLCGLMFRILGPRFFHEYWFEKSLFTWGWVTGVTAMGITLMRIVDTKNRGQALNDFAVAYLFVGPVEIGLVAFGPQWIHAGHAWILAAATAILGAILFGSVLAARRR